MPKIITNFKYKAAAPNFDRDQVKTRAELSAATLQDYDEGHIVYCVEDRKHYTFANVKDENGNPKKNAGTGYFNIFNSGTGTNSNLKNTHKTVFAFCHFRPVDPENDPFQKPATPIGWVWDTFNDKIIIPEDSIWVPDNEDELLPPVWMTTGNFYFEEPDNPTWSEPILASGEDGATEEFVYMLLREDEFFGDGYIPEVQNPNDVYLNDKLPKDAIIYSTKNADPQTRSWTDNPQSVNNEWRYEYTSIRRKPAGALSPEDGGVKWGEWSKPSLWSSFGVWGKDGDGVEYIFLRTRDNANPSKPEMTADWGINSKNYQETPEVVDHIKPWNGINWKDDPDDLNASYPLLWMSKRKKIPTNIESLLGVVDSEYRKELEKTLSNDRSNIGWWGEFSTPVVWSRYGKDGADGRDGATGNGISNVVDYYGVNNDINNPPEDWYTEYSGLDFGPNNIYLWNYETKYFTNGTSNSTSPHVICTYAADGTSGGDGSDGSDGADGEDGRGIEKIEITEYYATNQNPNTVPTSWSTTPPKINPGYYLWNYEVTVITYTDGTTETFETEKHIVGAYGEKGDDGTSITPKGEYASKEALYAAYDNGTIQKVVGDAYLVGEDLWVISTELNAEGYPFMCITNFKGAPGEPGETMYLHIKYCDNDKVMTAPETVKNEELKEDGGKFIGVTYSTVDDDPDTASSYTWSRLAPIRSFVSHVFKRSNDTTVAAPEGGSFASPEPSGWTDGIPEGEAQVWMSSRTFSEDGTWPQTDKWTTPQPITDTATIDFEYSSTDTSDPGTPTNPLNGAVWGNVSSKATIWMAKRECKNGVWGAWNVFKVKGEKGDPGTGINVKGSYKTLDELKAGVTNPSEGDCYMVDGICYVWDGDEWIDAGQIKGADGNGIKTIECKYLTSNDGNNHPDETAAWLDYSPMTDETNKYLWKRTFIYYTNPDLDTFKYYEIVGTHGEKGIDGTDVEWAYKLTATFSQPTDTPPKGDSVTDNTDPGLWTDDPIGPDGIKYFYEWVSKRVKTYNKETGKYDWSDWSEASLWSKWSKDGKNGKNITSINAEYGIGSSNSSYSDVTWYPSSPEVTSSKPWLWKRYKVVFDDGTESNSWVYEVIGKKGDTGIDGPGVEYAYKLTTSESTPSKPGDGEVTGSTRGEWTDEPLSMYGDYKFQYVSKRTSSDGGWSSWSTPVLWAELYPGSYLHIKYSDDDRVISNKYASGIAISDDVKKYIGMYVDMVKEDSDSASSYDWKKFEGNDGFSREYIFQLGTESAPDVPTDNSQSDQYAPSNWSLDPTSPNANNKYCWCCHRDKINGTWSDWKGNSNAPHKAYMFSMYAESVQGATGDSGPIVYPAGVYSSGTAYTQTKTNGKVTATPYVRYGSDYYILNVATSSTSWDSSQWIKMEYFNAVYAEILLAKNALVGAAVFNGNWMFSQQGSGSYSYFDPSLSDPYTNSSFKPAWCVNLVTGEMWAGLGKCYFDADGSGHLAGGNIEWNSDGSELMIGGGSNWTDNYINLTNTGLTIGSSVPSVASGKDTVTIKQDSIQIIASPSGAGIMINKYGIYNRIGGAAEWKSMIPSTKMEFVSSLPTSPDDNTLYIIT